MILIPEREIIVLLVPRTGSTSLRKAITERYPRAMPLYRHMEADGVPIHYNRWEKIGVLRNPLDRLWSLYNYCKTVKASFSEEHAQKLNYTTTRFGFEEWLLRNNVPFCDPWAHESGFSAYYSCLHIRPENKKSQAVYLRRDLGTIIFSYDRLELLEEELDIKLPRTNSSGAKKGPPPLSDEAKRHMTRYFHWDTCTHAELLDHGGVIT